MNDLANSDAAIQNEVPGEVPKTPRIHGYSPRVLDTVEIARFWSRVEVRKGHQCWPWRYGQDHGGYGEVRIGTTAEASHRIAYRIATGDIPAGMVIRHNCDNRLCCNPAHLLIGTHADNVADRVERDRSARGERSGRAKLTDEQVIHMRESPLSNLYFSKRYKLDIKTISDARSGKTWTHI